MPFVTERIQQAVATLLQQGRPFDAVFAASDLMAMTVISSLRQRQWFRWQQWTRSCGIRLPGHRLHPPVDTVA